MKNKNKIDDKTHMEYTKRFANGEQYIEINFYGEIVEIEKTYFWQQREVYNHIKPLINSLNLPEDLFEKELYGKNGLVDNLIPLQKAYNEIKNRKHEYINRLSIGILCVEDGSVDTDKLEEELYAGKIITYRQGATPPTMLRIEDKTLYDCLIKEENAILKEINTIGQNFIKGGNNEKDN